MSAKQQTASVPVEAGAAASSEVGASTAAGLAPLGLLAPLPPPPHNQAQQHIPPPLAVPLSSPPAAAAASGKAPKASDAAAAAAASALSTAAAAAATSSSSSSSSSAVAVLHDAVGVVAAAVGAADAHKVKRVRKAPTRDGGASDGGGSGGGGGAPSGKDGNGGRPAEVLEPRREMAYNIIKRGLYRFRELYGHTTVKRTFVVPDNDPQVTPIPSPPIQNSIQRPCPAFSSDLMLHRTLV